jgi:signal transduction histidine kinase
LDSEGLIATIHAHIGELAKEPGAPEFDLNAGGITEPPRTMGTTAYRIVREAIANAVKHGEATHVSIRLEPRDGGLFIQVEDDGQGFDVEASPISGHIGLASMRERAELAGGWSLLESVPGSGTTVSCWLPTEGTREPEGSDLREP